MAEAPCVHCRGRGFDPWSGNSDSPQAPRWGPKHLQTVMQAMKNERKAVLEGDEVGAALDGDQGGLSEEVTGAQGRPGGGAAPGGLVGSGRPAPRQGQRA